MQQERIERREFELEKKAQNDAIDKKRKDLEADQQKWF